MTKKNVAECDRFISIIIDEATNESGQHLTRVKKHMDECEACRGLFNEYKRLIGKPENIYLVKE